MFNLQKMMNSFNAMFKSKKIVNVTKNMNSILYNRVLLYALFILSLLDLFYLANVKDYISVAIFLLVGYLTSFFSKNMVVILFIAICVTHIVKYPRSLEGAENMNEEEEIEEDEEGIRNKEGAENIDDEEEEDLEEMGNIKGELDKFADVQNQLIGGMEKLEPLMKKAEGFIEKFEKYNKDKDNKKQK